MANKDTIVAFINKINEEDELQKKVSQLTKKDWEGFSAIAKEAGFEVDIEYGLFANACLSSEVNYFCPVLIQFAGQLHTFKM